MIDILNASVQFGGEYLFSDVNLKINSGDRAALVGANGTGKSTFFKLLTGKLDVEEGKIQRQKGIKIGHLPQEFIGLYGNPLFKEVKSSLKEINEIESEEERIKLQLEAGTGSRDELLHKLGDLEHKKETIDFYGADARIKKTLKGLGFEEKDFIRDTGEFSGGWQMRIELAKILLQNNDIILLDEPTNHLDIDSLQWLISFLADYRGTLIIISHDRFFINRLTDKTLEVFNKKISFYKGNYEEYLNYKEERKELLQKQKETQEKKRKETERFIERFRYKASKAKQVQSRIKSLEKIDDIEIEDERKNIELKFPEPERSGKIVLTYEHIYKSYGEIKVFDDLNFEMERGDKIVLLGPNGAGKSTFAKMAAGIVKQDKGNITPGHNVTVSYFAQESADNLNLELDILDTLQEQAEDLTPGKLRSILGSFLFSNDDVFKKVGVLSGGEKSRVALAKILLQRANLIILDEPTNHLDFESKRVLQKALIDFPGSMIIVSHDIDFVRPIANKVIEIRKNFFKEYPGDLEYYFVKREELFGGTSGFAQNKQIDISKRKDQKRQEAELRQKRYKATKNLKRRLEIVEEEIHTLEEKKSAVENELADPETYNNPAKIKELNINLEKLKKDLEIKFDTWTHITEELEEIENSLAN